MKRASYIIAVLSFAVACNNLAQPEDCTPISKQNVGNVSATVPGELIVKMTESFAEKVERENAEGTFDGSLAALGINSFERVFPDAGEWEPRHREAGLHLWYKLHFDPELPLTKASDDISSLAGIISTEPVRQIKKNSSFDDPMLPQQWALFNDGSRGANYAAGCDVNVFPVWDTYTCGNNNVIVAVLDEGVDLTHPDLADACIAAGPGGSKSFVSGHTGYDIEKGDHGTHVAGIIGAINNNGLGICGIAGGDGNNPGVKIMSCAILMEDPNDPTKTIGGNDSGAFVWAADNGAVIANNSWGYVYETEKDAAKGSVGLVKEAIDYFIKYAGCDKDGEQRPDSPMKGGVVIFASGNEAWEHGWPAKYEKVIAVGAVNSKNGRAHYSNFGDWVDICAPGGDIAVGPMILSTVADGKYKEFQGTSMACPMVSGVAALIASHFGGQGFTNEMLVERLLKGASEARAPKYGEIGPLVDALGAFTYGSTIAPEPVESFANIDVKSNFVTLSWNQTKDEDDVKAYSYLLMASKDREVFDSLDPNNIPQSVTTKIFIPEQIGVGDLVECTMEDFDFSTVYYFCAVACDYSGNKSALSPVVEVTTGINHAPDITTSYTGDYTIKSHESLSLDFDITDPDGHTVEIMFDPGSKAAVADTRQSSIHIDIRGLKDNPGKYTATITAKDKFGMSSSLVFEYVILQNHAPRIVKEFDNIMFNGIGESKTVDLDGYFVDDDGETLAYQADLALSGIAHLNPVGSKMEITPLGFGLTEATVTAKDARGEKCTATLKVLVMDSSRAVVLYPNPVKNTLNIRPCIDGKLDITISNKAGAVVYESSHDASPFYPPSIDMSEMPAGVYYVRLSGCNADGSYSVVKI